MSKFSEHSLRLPSREGLLVGWVGLLASCATLAIGLLILGGYGLKDPVTLAVLTVVWPDWIEVTTGLDPDQHSGAIE